MNIHNGKPEIWAQVDPQYDVAEVFQRFLIQLEGLLAPIGKEVQPLIEDQGNSLSAKLAVKLPSGWMANFSEVRWPSSKSQNAYEVEEIPAVTFSVHRNIEYKDPYTTITISFASGCFGKSSERNRAMSLVVAKDLASGGEDDVLSRFKLHTQTLFESVERFEIQHQEFFQKVECEVVGQVLIFLEGVSKKKDFLLQTQELDTPKDAAIAGGVTSKMSWCWSTAEQLEMIEWAERISWDGFLSERALSFLQKAKQNDEFAERLHIACIRSGKHTWEGLLKVLTYSPVSLACQKIIISFIADPNWPGAGQAYSYLKKNRKDCLQALRERLGDAQAAKDDWWAGNIQELIGDSDE